MIAATLSLLLMADFFGIIPNPNDEKLKARSRLSESLTVQLSSAASRNDTQAINDTIASIVLRDPTMNSIAMRNSDGQAIAMTKDHARFWELEEDSLSTSTNVHVPLYDGDVYWGRVEIAYSPVDRLYEWLGIPSSTLKLLAFVFVSGLLAHYLLLGRVLRALNPDRVIPNRIQSAFDTLDEGVAILDEKERVLLVNRVLADLIGKPTNEIIGVNIEEFNWRHWQEDSTNISYPWRTAITERLTSVKVPVGFRSSSNEICSFNVNASCIVDEEGNTSGAIVTFSDVTNIEKQNANLEMTVSRLLETEENLVQKNTELQFLANHDPLTGCLNRRTFFARFEEKFEKAAAGSNSLTCMMLDLDHFKSINDRFGHAVGDSVIVGLANVLMSNCSDNDLVGRYGGEEFCVILDGRDEAASIRLAEQIRQEVLACSPEWLNRADTVSVSIGFTTKSDGAATSDDMNVQADKALYVAKETGRNKVVGWRDTLGYSDTGAQQPSNLAAKAKSAASQVNANPQKAIGSKPILAFGQTNPGQPAAVGRSSQSEKRLAEPARLKLNSWLSDALADAGRNNHKVSVLNLSVDTAAMIAEAFGAREFNSVIEAAHQRLSKILGRNDTVSLLGGKDLQIFFSRHESSQFAIVIPAVEKIESVYWMIKRIIDAFSEPFTVESRNHYLKCTIGASIYPNDGNGVEELLKNAEIAMNKAIQEKDANHYRFYSSEMVESTRNQLLIESGIRGALKNDDFRLYYQPIIDAQSGQVVAAEALLRCISPELQSIPTGMLISLAEQSELINKIGDWVIAAAISQMEEWEKQGTAPPMLSINVSAMQLEDPQTSKRIVAALLNSSTNPSKFQFEVTETGFLNDLKHAGGALRKLQKLGAQIALDDFGTCQSSLTYLQRLSPDTIKIDQSFVDGIDKSHANVELVRAMVNMSDNLGLRVVAEGVETENQLTILKCIGEMEIQGYLIAPPMPEDVFIDWYKLFDELKSGQRDPGQFVQQNTRKSA
ncbi:MAG: EAL domain-containing protein [Pseudomonadota bacterium]